MDKYVNHEDVCVCCGRYVPEGTMICNLCSETTNNIYGEINDKKEKLKMNRQNELFGKLCRDKITGFEGVCTGRTVWLYGCDQYCLTPRVEENKSNELKDGKWFDDGRIEIVEEFVKPQDVQVEKRGGEHDLSYYPNNSRI